MKWLALAMMAALTGCITAPEQESQLRIGPLLKIHSWLSNGVLYAGVDVPACYFAKLERTLSLSPARWMTADSADEQYITRRVVFSERLVFEKAFYRVQLLAVDGCPTLK